MYLASLLSITDTTNNRRYNFKTLKFNFHIVCVCTRVLLKRCIFDVFKGENKTTKSVVGFVYYMFCDKYFLLVPDLQCRL